MSVTKTIQLLGTAALVAFASSSAWACSPAPTRAWLKPINVSSDCSFENAGRGRWGHGRGGAAVDIGGGRVGQKITYGMNSCHAVEVLLFANCAAENGIILEGKFDSEVLIAGASFSRIAVIQKPDGPIGVTRKSTVEELTKIAEANDISYLTDLQSFFQENSDLKRFNYLCGCELHYPDSPGAKL